MCRRVIFILTVKFLGLTLLYSLAYVIRRYPIQSSEKRVDARIFIAGLKGYRL